MMITHGQRRRVRLGWLRTAFMGVFLALFGGPVFGPVLGPVWDLQSAAEAQQLAVVTAPDYTAWNQVATRAQAAVEAARASNRALEELRAQIVSWRDKFKGARTLNKPAIQTLQAQLKALGPPPKNGVEQAGIAAQRADMDTKLADLTAPVKRGEVAYSRADSLVAAVDKIIRDRQKTALLRLGPTPLNPAHWSVGLVAVTNIWHGISSEVTTAWASPIQRTDLQQNLPKILFFLILSLVLLLRGRHWVLHLGQSVAASNLARWAGSEAGRWTAGFMLSIGQVLLPLLGLIALVQAAYATGLVGVRGDIILARVPQMGAALFGARWLGTRVFPRDPSIIAPLTLSAEQRRSGQRFSWLLGIFYGLYIVLLAVSKFGKWPAEALVVVMFPLMLASALVLLRLGRLLLAHVRKNSSDDKERSYRDRLIQLVGRAVILVAAVAPLLAAVGYAQAAQALEFPTILSLGLLGFIALFQRVVTEIYALLSGNKAEAKDALAPVLVNFMLILASTPVFALIWGARVTDLNDLWTRFQTGFTLGGTTVSPTSFLTFAVLFVSGYVVTRLVQGSLRTTVLPKTRIDVGGRHAIVSGVGYIGIFLAAVMAITGAGIDLSSLAIVAGALSVGIGFGLQNIVSNFVSGIILLIERPISEGDWIEVGDKMGYVRAISVRSTRIETFDRTDVIIPNTDLVSGTVTNWTRGNLVGRAIIPVGVAYGTDTKKVETILREIASAHPMVLTNPAPGVVFSGFGPDSLDFQIRAILRDINFGLSVRSDIRHEIVRRFAEENITIPFAQRDLWLRNPEALTGSGPRGANPIKGDVDTAPEAATPEAATPKEPMAKKDPGQ